MQQRKPLTRKSPLQSKRRPRKCRACGKPYTPSSTTQKACSPGCALKIGREDRAKRERALDRERKRLNRVALERLKPRSQHMREAQAAFNAWVRERDHGKPCISCGKHESEMRGALTGGMFDCGHYRSVGSCPELRFEPLNAHSQCKKCNRNLSGNVVEYRLRLRERIGDADLAWLEGNHAPRRYTIEDLKDIKAHYRRLARELKKRRQ